MLLLWWWWRLGKVDTENEPHMVVIVDMEKSLDSFSTCSGVLVAVDTEIEQQLILDMCE